MASDLPVKFNLSIKEEVMIKLVIEGDTDLIRSVKLFKAKLHTKYPNHNIQTGYHGNSYVVYYVNRKIADEIKDHIKELRKYYNAN